MGLLNTIAEGVESVADVAPIPGSDVVSEGIDTAQDILGGGNGGNGQPQGQMRTTGQRPAPMRNQATLGGGTRGPGGRSRGVARRDPPEGVRSGGMLNLPGFPSVGGGFSLTSPPTQPPQGQAQATQGGRRMQQNGQMPAIGSGAFMQAFVADLLDESVSGASRAVLEAIQSGSLQGGIIQKPTRVETPRGVEFHSQPGFRTVELNGQKVSVFKPVAKALNLLPGGSRTMREKVDDATREYLKYRRWYKDMASKLGFKSPKARKSGPSR